MEIEIQDQQEKHSPTHEETPVEETSSRAQHLLLFVVKHIHHSHLHYSVLEYVSIVLKVCLNISKKLLKVSKSL